MRNAIAHGNERGLILQSVHYRSESDFKSAESEEATRKSIGTIVKRMRLGISDGKFDPTGRQTSRHWQQYDGVTIRPLKGDDNIYRIYLAYQIIAPLLVDNLGPSIRLALQFHVALTLLHEFAVSILRLISS